MDQIKIGSFLKMLRNERKLTQEQLAEVVNVSRRTVSRWETGSNMPDLDVLIELADYYQVELREILDGERKGEQMDQKIKETALMVADYSNEEKQHMVRSMHVTFVIGSLAAISYLVMASNGLADSPAAEICLGGATGILLAGAIITSKYAAKIRAFKLRLLRRRKGAEE